MSNSKMKREELLLNSFLEYHERQVRKGTVSPFNGVERCIVGMTLAWICKGFRVVPKGGKQPHGNY